MRNCNLELRFVPPTISHFSDHHHQPMMRLMEEISEPIGQNQQLTIFYNGRVSFCDVTELQARAIILHASQGQGVEEKSKSQGQGSDEPLSPLLMASQLLGSCSPPASGISMKRSLQRFLQKRTHRIQSTSPYQQHH